ncbi:choline/ethanolamine kinase-like isoform X1 [Mytilus galloprovincialis]|uniref:choline/ethanolamine kinase-like isoform X1 n=1 Tax=Mytilus galloprovincialis TaxID=29158 RepID=UPI003F7B7A6B
MAQCKVLSSVDRMIFCQHIQKDYVFGNCSFLYGTVIRRKHKHSHRSRAHIPPIQQLSMTRYQSFGGIDRAVKAKQAMEDGRQMMTIGQLDIWTRYGPQILTKFIDKVQRVIYIVCELWRGGMCEKMNIEEHLERENKELILYQTHKDQGYQWCREFLGGSWSTIKKEDFIFTTLGGGLTNLLYTCELSDNIQTQNNEPRTVLLRVYGDIAKDLKFLVQNSVVFCLLSEKQLGPKCYGLYPNGRIEEYIPTKSLTRKDLHKPEISSMIARKLAVIHNLNMPLCKEPRFLGELTRHWLAEAKNNTRPDDTDPNIQKITSYDLDAELSWLLKKIEDLKSPVVFSHNDLQEGNLLYMKDCKDPEKQLTVIDLEYCSYNYRGFDFGNHFCEWCLDYQSEQEMPYYSYHEDSYPSKEQQFHFFRAYLDAKNEACTDEVLETLYIEANTCALASHLMWLVWSIVQRDKSDIQFGYLEYAVCRLEAYFRLKKELFPDEKDKV